MVQVTKDANEVDNSLSLLFSVTNGVRQGGVLSPILFTVYLDDLLYRLKSLGLDVIGMAYLLVQSHNYADDAHSSSISFLVSYPDPPSTLHIAFLALSALHLMLKHCEEFISNIWIIKTQNVAEVNNSISETPENEIIAGHKWEGWVPKRMSWVLLALKDKPLEMVSYLKPVT